MGLQVWHGLDNLGRLENDVLQLQLVTNEELFVLSLPKTRCAIGREKRLVTELPTEMS